MRWAVGEASRRRAYDLLALAEALPIGEQRDRLHRIGWTKTSVIAECPRNGTVHHTLAQMLDLAELSDDGQTADYALHLIRLLRVVRGLRNASVTTVRLIANLEFALPPSLARRLCELKVRGSKEGRVNSD